ncbi:MAG: hypothetical protein WA840_00020 [Caulobacteraceae bacterium]
MVVLAPGRDRFDMGRVVQRAVDSLKLNLVNFALVAIIVFAVPKILLDVLRVLITPHTLGAQMSPGVAGFSFVFSLVSLFLGCIVQAAIVKASVEGRRDSVGDMIAIGLRFGLPLLGLTILLVIALMVGFILLIVPGVILAIVWSVTTPAVVLEGTGVFGSFGRSSALTRGSRWSIFLLYLLWGLAIIVVSMILLAPFGFGVGLMRAGGLSGMLVIYTVIAAVWSTVITILQTVLVASIYSELRMIKEGVAPGGVAQTFD